jgi:hypothetical protein
MGTMKNEPRHSNAEERKKTFRVAGGYHPITKMRIPKWSHAQIEPPSH